MAVKYSTTLRNAQLDVISGASGIGGSGLLRIYSGSRPANVAAAISGTLLAELTLNATFAPAAASGVLTANAITGDTSANATGTATHFRIWKSDGTTAVIDGDVATSASDLNLTSTSIVATEPVTVTSLTITRGNA
jgi:hypothetical protein